MNRAALSALFGHWRRNPLQLLTLLGGIALATALWSGVQAINAEARASYADAAGSLSEAFGTARLVAREGAAIAPEDFVTLRRAGWLVSPVIEGRHEGLRLLGLDALTLPAPAGGEALIAPEALPDLLGEEVVFLAQAQVARDRPDLPILVTAAAPPGTLLADIDRARALLGRAEETDAFLLAPTQPLRHAPLEDVAPHLERAAEAGGADLARLTDSFHLNLTAFGLLSFAVGIFIVHGAIGLAFEQRRGMMRVMRTLGLPLGRLVALMAAELALLALVAGAVGLALGYAIAAALLPDVAATLRGLYGAEVAGGLSFRPIWALSGLAIAMTGTALAGAGALWRLSRLPLVATAQPRALARASARSTRMQAAASFLLLALAGLLAIDAQGLVAGFALLAALLIGAALALPPVLALLLGALARGARGVRAEWFWADTRQQLPGLSLALMALLLAMAANVGVSTMVSSFRLTFLGFLDQRLAPELYLRLDDPAAGAEAAAWAAGRVEAVLPIRTAPSEVAGQPVEVAGPRDHATYREGWALLEGAAGAWDAVFAGQGALVNEQLARRAGLSPGSVIDLGGQAFEVLGSYGDYGNPLGQVIVSEEVFAALFPEAVPEAWGLRLPPERAAAFAAEMTRSLDLPPGALVDQAAVKALSVEIFDRTFAVTRALNVLTLAVAGFAMLMSLLTLATMRLPQLAPVWAMGLTRAALGRIELLRAVVLAALTGALALPLGLALAWVLLAIVNVAAFGWRLPLHLFPLDYARLFLFTILAAALAAGWPALRLSRIAPARLLQVFAHER